MGLTGLLESVGFIVIMVTLINLFQYLFTGNPLDLDLFILFGSTMMIGLMLYGVNNLLKVFFEDEDE